MGYEIVDPLNIRRRNTVASGTISTDAVALDHNEDDGIKTEDKSQSGSPEKHEHDHDHDLEGTIRVEGGSNKAKLLSVSNLLSR